MTDSGTTISRAEAFAQLHRDHQPLVLPTVWDVWSARLAVGLRAAADNAGVPVWINGRTDLFAHAEDPAAVLEEAISRLGALVTAGANSVYPVRIQDSDELLTAVVGALEVPVNSTGHPVRLDLGRFRRLGVGRVSFGPLFQAALSDSAREMLARWR